ncbi:MAG: glycoside hydrolase family 5 protein [Fibrobacter sp.]|nr:glycoside hydrolase family 5 protein [Fibrobacter sp.]
MKMKNVLLSLAMLAAAPAFAGALDCTPKRVGPVSIYGALHTSGNKIIGAKNNEQAMLRGMSLFWSDGTGQPYYNKNVIAWAADNLKIDVFRFALGIQYYDSDGGTKNALATESSYKGSPDAYLGLVDQMVAAAIESDVYIIIDWHSHRAHTETSLAKTFFETVSKKYKDVPNVIYEIYNEPVDGSGGNWSAVKSYANTICPIIRNSTQNLIIVGTPSWSQNPQNGANDPVNSTNIAYVLHFYAGTHSKGSFSGRIDQTLNAGYPVFISEWGTTNADGDGEPNSSATSEWTSYMDQKMIPNCNWSLRQLTSAIDKKSEKSAMFAGNVVLNNFSSLSEAEYTASGKIVKEYLTKNGRNWADSLVKGKNSGNCAFKSVSVKQTESQITNALKSGCTYTSSNDAVVSVSGSTLDVHDYGYAIIKGDDGSESVVSVTQVAGQSIPSFSDASCDYAGNCKNAKGSSQSLDYDDDGKNEYLLTVANTTIEGATFTLKSLNPEIVNVKNATCKIASCSGSMHNNKVWMFELNSFGEAKIVATAPAVSGYRAMQDTITFKYTKANNRITSKFSDLTLSPGETSKEGILPDTTLMGTKITYTFDGEPTCKYLSRSGTSVVAGDQNAVITITANVEESEFYKPIVASMTVTIGDATTAVNLAEHLAYLNQGNEEDDAIHYSMVTSHGLKAQITGSTLSFSTERAGMVKLDVYDAIGNRVMRQSGRYGTGTHSVQLSNLSSGSYVAIVRQGSQSASVRWNKQ